MVRSIESAATKGNKSIALIECAEQQGETFSGIHGFSLLSASYMPDAGISIKEVRVTLHAVTQEAQCALGTCKAGSCLDQGLSPRSVCMKGGTSWTVLYVWATFLTLLYSHLACELLKFNYSPRAVFLKKYF